MKQAATHCAEGWFASTKAAHVNGIGSNFKYGLQSLSEKTWICHGTSTHPESVMDHLGPGSKTPHLGYNLYALSV